MFSFSHFYYHINCILETRGRKDFLSFPSQKTFELGENCSGKVVVEVSDLIKNFKQKWT